MPFFLHLHSINALKTIEKADEQIKILNSCNKLWKEFAEMAGIQNPRPSSSQSAYLRTWSVELKFNVEMIYLAYEEMLNHSSKISFPYMNKILMNWHSKGIKTPDEIEKEKERSSEVEEYQEYVQSDEYVKDVAREKLGLVGPDEIVFEPAE